MHVSPDPSACEQTVSKHIPKTNTKVKPSVLQKKEIQIEHRHAQAYAEYIINTKDF